MQPLPQFTRHITLMGNKLIKLAQDMFPTKGSSVNNSLCVYVCVCVDIGRQTEEVRKQGMQNKYAKCGEYSDRQPHTIRVYTRNCHKFKHETKF